MISLAKQLTLIARQSLSIKPKIKLNIGNLKDRLLKGKFYRCYLDEMNAAKIRADVMDHNKLRLYRTFKGYFSQEPYITDVLNRN